MDIEKVDIEKVESLEFDRVWKFITEIGVYERHFNGLQVTYRTLASTWLLAALGGAGFVLEKLGTEPLRLGLLTAIGFLGGVGILLLWNLDLRLYHPLLSACFAQGAQLEEDHLWLPKVRGGMTNRLGGKNVAKVRIMTYYLFSCALLFGLGCVSFPFWLQALNVRYAFVLACLPALALVVALIRLCRATIPDSGEKAQAELVKQARQGS